MGNQGMGGPGGGRNPFGQMSEEDKKKARERRQEECKFNIQYISIEPFHIQAYIFLITWNLTYDI